MLGITVGYVLMSLLFDGIYLHFANLFVSGSFMHELVAYVLIPYMQHTGLYSLLNERNLHSIFADGFNLNIVYGYFRMDSIPSICSR